MVTFDGGGMTVKGSAVLNAAGTAEAPIIFTSIKNVAAGGESGDDGGATVPAMNEYHHVRSTGVDALMHSEHAQFRYGEGSRAASPVGEADDGSTASVRHCAFSQAEVGVTV